MRPSRPHSPDGQPMEPPRTHEDPAAAGTWRRPGRRSRPSSPALFVLGLVVAFDSWQLGAGWARRWPGAGYFPFYIGLLICIARRRHRLSGACSRRSRDARSSSTSPAEAVCCTVLLADAGLRAWRCRLLGIYVGSALFIALFMVVLGKYPWLKSAGHRHRGSAVLLPHVRGLVQGAAVQGPAEALRLPRVLKPRRPWKKSQRLIQGFAVVLTPVQPAA